MDTKKMEGFIAAVEERSFEKAAERCFITQTTLSRQIASLEQELGVTLFDRSHYRATLTQAGQSFYLDSKNIMNDYKRAVRRALLSSQSYTSKITLGITGPLEVKLLPAVIRTFSEDYPKIDVEIQKKTFQALIQGMYDKKIDIIFGLYNEIKEIHSIKIIKLQTLTPCVILPKNHSLATRTFVNGKELCHERFIVFSKEFSRQHYQEHQKCCILDGFEPMISKVVNSLEEMLLEVSIGRGIAITSQEVLRSFDEIAMVPLHETHHSATYCMGIDQEICREEVEEFLSYIFWNEEKMM